MIQKIHPLIACFAIALLMLAGCQEVVEPPTATMRNVRIIVQKNTGTPVTDAEMTFYRDSTNTSWVARDTTGIDGMASIRLPIPNFGSTFSLLIRKGNSYQRTFYPLFLKCVDTTITIILPQYASGSDTAVIERTICSDPPETLPLRFIACPTETVEQVVEVTNGCAATVDFPLPNTPSSPFAMSVTRGGAPVTGTQSLAPGEKIRLVFSYSGVDQIRGSSATVSLRNSVGGGIDVKLFGEPNKVCDHPPIDIRCDGPVDVSTACPIGRVCVGKLMGSMTMHLRNTATEPQEVTVPVIPPPFIAEVHDNSGAKVTTNRIVLQPGESMSVTLSIKAEKEGNYPFKLILGVRCLNNGHQKQVSEVFDAIAEVCSDCYCPGGEEYIQIPDPVPVGRDTVVDETVFTNDRDCPIQVRLNGPASNATWGLLDAGLLPVTVQPGGTLRLRFRFTPSKGGKDQFTLPLQLVPEGGPGPCSYNVILSAGGCVTACPNIDPPSAYRPGASGNVDTLFLEESGARRVFVSTPGRENASKIECFRIENPDTACNTMTINITPPTSPFKMFSPSSSTITLAPGESAQLCIQFVAPLLDDVRARVRAKLGLIYRDSLSIRTVGPNNATLCLRQLPMQAEVDTLPRCGERQSLALYDQTTSEAPSPAFEVYSFSSSRKFIDTRAGGGYIGQLPGSYFPLIHDLYIDDGAGGAPTINIVNGGANRGLALVQPNSRLADFCDNIEALLRAVRPQLPSYSYGAAVPAQKGDILAVRLGASSYALVLVSGIDMGSGNIAGRTIVDYYVLYPVLP